MKKLIFILFVFIGSLTIAQTKHVNHDIMINTKITMTIDIDLKIDNINDIDNIKIIDNNSNIIYDNDKDKSLIIFKDGKYQINIDGLSNGTYFLRIETKKETKVQRFIVSK